MSMLNPWHNVRIGANAPAEVNGIIEIPKNSRAKYELDKESGMLILDRVIYSAMHYPANYGFIPRTYCDDGDPLDILILTQITVDPLCIVPAKVIGAMQMLDQGEKDDKIIAVAIGDMSVSHLDDIADLGAHFVKELQNFFEDYKKLENKTVVIEDFQNRDVAIEIVKKAMSDYQDKYK